MQRSYLTIIVFVCCIVGINAQQDVVINEFMAVNDSTSNITDPAGETDDWIELYNTGASAANMINCHLTDNDSLLGKWTFPAGVTIAAGGYLIIWADNDVTQEGLHANFKLSSSGEQLVLTDPNFGVIDSFTYTAIENNHSWARFPNGTGNFSSQGVVTYNANNGTSSTATPAEARQLYRLWPANGQLVVQWQREERNANIRLVSALGQIISTGTETQTTAGLRTLLNTPTTSGVYFVEVVIGGKSYTQSIFIP